MALFQSVTTNFASLGLESSQRRFNRKMLKMVLCYGTQVSLSVVYLFKEATSFKQYTECMYVTCTSITISISYTIVVLQTKHLFEIIEDLSKLIEERSKFPALKAFYDKANRKVELLSIISDYVVAKILPVVCVLGKFVIRLCDYWFTADLGRDELELPFPMWVPFDTQNPFGYSIAMFLQYIMFYLDSFLCSCVLSLGVGFYLFGMAMEEDIKKTFYAIKVDPKNKQGAVQNLVQLANFIQIHSMIKQFVQKCSLFYRDMTALIFTWSLLTICGAMLMFEMEISHAEINVLIVMEAMIYAIVAFAISFLVCELAQSITDKFDEISYRFDEFEWYLFAMNFKRTLLTVLTVVQQRVTVNCFGSIACNRETFKKIANGGYSYYNVLRRFIK